MAALSPPRGERAGLSLLAAVAVVAVLALALLGFALVRVPRAALHAYLVAFTWVVSIQLGALILLMIGHLVGSRWMLVVRRLAETIAAGLPLSALLFLPLAVQLPSLYAWAAPTDTLHGHLAEAVAHKRAYLNPAFFLARSAVYFLLWSALALVLRGASLRQDRAASPAPLLSARAISAAGLPLVGISMSFAAFDWLMSLEPAWFSTAFGVYYFAGGFVAAIATLILGARVLEGRGPLRGVIGRAHYHALGRLLFAFTIFWAYIAFYQWFLIYIADKPEETPFYLARLHGPWRVIAWGLSVGHFALPFLALLPRAVKQRGGSLSAIAGWLLLMHLMDLYWLVMPALRAPGPGLDWILPIAVLAVGGLPLALATWQLRDGAVTPRMDPGWPAALRYRSP